MRSCYRTLMRFSAGTPLVEVRWFRSPAGAPLLNRESSFVSLNWRTEGTGDYDQGLAGEVPGAPRPWSNGDTPGRLDMGYRGPAGPDDYWFAGAPSPIWLALALNFNGIPLACGAAAHPCYAPGLPAVLYIRIVEVSGNMGVIAGDYELTAVNATVWNVKYPTVIGEIWWDLICLGGVEWYFTYALAGGSNRDRNIPLTTAVPFVLDIPAFETYYAGPGDLEGVFNIEIRSTPFV